MYQLELLPARTRCGYCDRELAAQGDGTYACPRCSPLLADVRTVEEWAAFQRAARREVVPCPQG